MPRSANEEKAQRRGGVRARAEVVTGAEVELPPPPPPILEPGSLPLPPPLQSSPLPSLLPLPPEEWA